MTKKTRAKMRRAMLTLSLVLVMMMAAVGGTIAWLVDDTETIVNTFSPAEIEITLVENAKADGTDSWVAHMVPGKEYTKDPVVSVVDTATDVDVYLFVKFDAANVDTYVAYTSMLTKAGEGWTLVPGQTNVWYRVVEDDAEVQSWHLIEGDTVTIKDSVTQDNMTAAAAVKMEYTAYAIQYEGFEDDPAGAWAEIAGTGN